MPPIVWRMKTPDSLIAQSPEEVLAAVPYLLGFHPQQSFVVVALRGRRVVFTARADLDHALWEADRLARVVDTNNADALILLGFCEPTAESRDLLADLAELFGDFRIHDLLLSDGERWWSLLCDDADCCPDEGTPYDISTTRFAAAAVAAGLPALPSRAELVQRVTGPIGEVDRQEVRAAFEEVLPDLAGWSAEERCGRIRRLIARYNTSRGLSDTECAELAVLSHDPVARDEMLGRLRRVDAPRQVALWNRVVDRSLPPFEVAPLCLLGLAAWLSGNGALQVICMERAERINAGFSMLSLLNHIHDRAIPPSHWGEGAAA
ncbi:hypothetical protein CGZ96_10005 [Enemella evansiae]|nr:hypothetical protein CGZ96_10005 [Enemella evansiae]